MEYIKKLLCLTLAACMVFGCAPQLILAASAAEEDTEEPESVYVWITDRESVRGGDYTDDTALAESLDAIFDGSASIYYDFERTRLVDTKLGSSSVRNNGVNMYTGPEGLVATNVGTSCWIYANGVYYTLFGEATGCGAAGENSEKLNLSGTENKNFTYENFSAWGVRPGVGALIRTACGHSMIVLGYDAEKITILDGNGNGKGLVSIRVMSWERQSFRVKYIIQPKQEHLDALYPGESGRAV